jgi:hypothetical protein
VQGCRLEKGRGVFKGYLMKKACGVLKGYLKTRCRAMTYHRRMFTGRHSYALQCVDALRE